MICLRCKKEKIPEEFTLNRSRPSGFGNYCKQCHREYERDRVPNPKRYQRDINLSRGLKTCSRCEIEQSLDNFTLGSGQSGYYNYCKSCSSLRTKERRQLMPRKFKANQIKYRYNLSLDDVSFIYGCQGGRCNICEKSFPLNKLQIDHDHSCCSGERSCGKCIRGLLCGSCNKMLGFSVDSIEILSKGIQYLKEETWQ